MKTVQPDAGEDDRRGAGDGRRAQGRAAEHPGTIVPAPRPAWDRKGPRRRRRAAEHRRPPTAAIAGRAAAATVIDAPTDEQPDPSRDA